MYAQKQYDCKWLGGKLHCKNKMQEPIIIIPGRQESTAKIHIGLLYHYYFKLVLWPFGVIINSVGLAGRKAVVAFVFILGDILT